MSGRRLRHINDELILKKWQDAKEKGIEFDADQETSTGIDLWFLSAPKWADGIKVDHRKRFMKSRGKTSLCIDWLRARESGSPPKNATKDWGCPRGAYCEFAHGEDELRGIEKDKLEEEKQQRYEEEKRKKRDEYMKPLQYMRSDEEINSLVLEGLQAAKKSKVSNGKSIITATTVPYSSSSSSSKIVEDKSESASKQDSKSRPTEAESPLQLLSGNVIAENLQMTPQIIGNSTFATITVPGSKSNAVGHWYYEVELLSDGLMQIGWINEEFRSNSEDGIGVGDDEHSWAFDGFRKKVFHGGKETAITYKQPALEPEVKDAQNDEKKEGEESDEDDDDEEEEEESWKEDDVVGCLLSIESIEGDDSRKKVEIGYYLNGVKVNPGFQFTVSNESAVFFPALSIEEQESIRLNLGKDIYKFPPSLISISNCL